MPGAEDGGTGRRSAPEPACQPKPRAPCHRDSSPQVRPHVDLPHSMAGGFLLRQTPVFLARSSALGVRGRIAPTVAMASAPLAWRARGATRQGQARLLDVVLDPALPTAAGSAPATRKPGEGGTAGTGGGYNRYASGEDRASDVQVLSTARCPPVTGGALLGSRICARWQGQHVSISQRCDPSSPRRWRQTPDRAAGQSLVRSPDGDHAGGQPVGVFAQLPVNWSHGHRNMQGLVTTRRSGRLWQSEHGSARRR